MMLGTTNIKILTANLNQMHSLAYPTSKPVSVISIRNLPSHNFWFSDKKKIKIKFSSFVTWKMCVIFNFHVKIKILTTIVFFFATSHTSLGWMRYELLCCFKAVYEKFSVKHMREGKGAYMILLGKSEGRRERERERGDSLFEKTRRRLRIILKWMLRK